NETRAQEVAVAEAVSRTETFFENNGKKVVIALVVLVLIVAAGYAYKKLVIDRNAERAAELIVEAQYNFEGATPDYSLALNGDDNVAGFLNVIEQYGSTPAGNLAKHYAGICYLRLGDKENAAKYLADYKEVAGIPAAIVNAQNLGLRGDIAADNGDYAEAVKLYKKAVAASDNEFTAPLYLYKEGLALIALGNKDEAVKCLERISTEYPSAVEAREAEKLLGATE
ncbi:MAG: tol-pal system YbgF family protein, partial [Alistipes sp.]